MSQATQLILNPTLRNPRPSELSWRPALALLASCRSFLIFSLLLTTTGCSSVTPPTGVKDPVPVYLAVYGVHTSVLLPYGPKNYVEYSFGDWAYAAENRQMPWNAFGALFISFQSALGRNWIYVGNSHDTPKTFRPTKRIERIFAERSKVEKVVKDLDRRYATGDRPPVYDPESNAFFVKDHTHYSWLNSCNQMTLDILESAGCEVHGWGVTSGISVKSK